MAKRQTSMGVEDTTAITHAVERGLSAYASGMGEVRVSDLVMEYGGSPAQLARALAGIPEGKLPGKGSDDRKAYDASLRSVNRWLNYEAGTGKQARNPNTKATQAKLKSLMARKRPPRSMSLTITGWIGYDNDVRWRTVGSPTPIHLSSERLSSFLENMQAGNTHAAYREVFTAYGASVLQVEQDPGTQIDLDFE